MCFRKNENEYHDGNDASQSDFSTETIYLFNGSNQSYYCYVAEQRSTNIRTNGTQGVDHNQNYLVNKF